MHIGHKYLITSKAAKNAGREIQVLDISLSFSLRNPVTTVEFKFTHTGDCVARPFRGSGFFIDKY